MKYIFQGLFQLLKKPWCRGYRKMGKPKAFSSHLLKYLLCSVLLPYSSVSMKQESGFMFPKYSGNIQGSISMIYDRNWWNIKLIIFRRTCLVWYYHLNSYITDRIIYLIPCRRLFTWIHQICLLHCIIILCNYGITQWN